jgi:hypothetical protein
MKLIRLSLTSAFFAAILTGCGVTEGGSAPPAAASKSAPACNLDADKVCEEIARKPVTVNGVELGEREREQAGLRTNWEQTTITTPGGTHVAFSCGINAEHSAVVSAHALKGPPLTDADVIYLRSAGLCKG